MAPMTAATLIARESPSSCRSSLFSFRPSELLEHDLFGKPVSTFPDHALPTVLAVKPRYRIGPRGGVCAQRADGLELGLLLVAQLSVEIVQRRAHRFDGLQHGVESFVSGCKARR